MAKFVISRQRFESKVQNHFMNPKLHKTLMFHRKTLNTGQDWIHHWLIKSNGIQAQRISGQSHKGGSNHISVLVRWSPKKLNTVPASETDRKFRSSGESVVLR
jgi:hypothetical protein